VAANKHAFVLGSTRPGLGSARGIRPSELVSESQSCIPRHSDTAFPANPSLFSREIGLVACFPVNRTVHVIVVADR
jgi:hypothetical protein